MVAPCMVGGYHLCKHSMHRALRRCSLTVITRCDMYTALDVRWDVTDMLQ
jgi:hypothetical protein